MASGQLKRTYRYLLRTGMGVVRCQLNITEFSAENFLLGAKPAGSPYYHSRASLPFHSHYAPVTGEIEFATHN